MVVHSVEEGNILGCDFSLLPACLINFREENMR